MVEKRKISKYKYVVTFTITTSIFIIGILIGVIITDIKYSKLTAIEQDLKTQMLGLETQYAIVSKNICVASDVNFLTKELGEMGQLLSDLEFQLGKNDKKVLDLVNYYSLLEIRHWLFLKELKEKCGKKINLILYFYSNLGDCSKCDEQGYSLLFLKQKYSELNINIYSFNVNLNNPSIQALRNIYDIKSVPGVIINEKVYNNYLPIEELERAISKS